MIRYLLDIGVTSKANKAKGDKNVQAWLGSVSDDELAISVITLRERPEGAENAKYKGSPAAADIAADVEDLARAFAGRILPLDEDTGRHWARLLVPDGSKADDKAQLAIAMARGLTLVTTNWRDVAGRGVSVLKSGSHSPKLYDP
ncbi:putative plasmid stabilization protein [Methylorubrum populi BJ001]|jgi:predicted nucleic acid-binding protein|uniref:Putative plasmid stabilization protein n=1 Tax=Methylorubrum populi (strain ATCC BAA-705 / NCIMB 13946 / BJ001) TaxID=441620 RepID=B1Z9L3_METPB|nr:PIN domain-containing protein [Methylorubrum populi]ACB81977.1 putative plasmid stabilization protein [Methylorubrum populi BJ001]